MRIWTALTLAAALLSGQDKPEYTFGTTVVSNSWLHGQIYDLKPDTGHVPRLDRLKPVGTIYTNMLNVLATAVRPGLPGNHGPVRVVCHRL